MSVFLARGDAPLSAAQFQRRTQKYIQRDWPNWKRERALRTGDAALNNFMAEIDADTDINRANNLFNTQLVAYRKAVARLENYLVSEGREEIRQDIPTGELDNNGDPVLESRVVQYAIDALPATVAQTIYDEIGDSIATEIENPLITIDVGERAEAQEIINATPPEVAEFEASA